MKRILLLALALATGLTARAYMGFDAPASVASGETYSFSAWGASGYSYTTNYVTIFKNSTFVSCGYGGYNEASTSGSTTDYGAQTVYYDVYVDWYVWWDENGGGGESGSWTVNINAGNNPPTIQWVQNPSSAAVNEWFSMQAYGADSDGNLVAVSVWRDGVPHAFEDGGNGYERYGAANGTSQSYTGTITFTAQATDSNGATSDMIYHPVNIYNNGPSVSGSADSIYVNQTATVSWSASDPDNNLSYVNVWVTQWGSPYWDDLGSGGASGSKSWSSSANFNSANPATGAYLFVIRAVDAEGAYSDTYATFDVINRAPDSPTVSSGGVTQINLGQSVTISGTVHDADGNLAYHNLWHAAPGSGSWTGILSGTPSNATSSSLSTSYTPNAIGTWQFRSNGHDGIVWSADATLSVSVVDGTAPSVPAGLAASSVAATSFTLSWSSSSDNIGVTAYDVRRNGSSLGTTGGTSMSITGLTQGTPYSMTVLARDAAGNWSAASSALVVTTLDTQSPSVPAGLASSSVTATSFTLTWNASSDNIGVTAYEVMRGTTSLGPIAGTSMSITGLTQGTAYSMTVRAKDAAGNPSGWSTALVVTTTDTQAPSVPTGLAYSSLGTNSFTLSWTASTDNLGVTAYEVFRGTTSLGTTAGTSMSVTGLTPSTGYAMTVKARDAVPNWSAASSVLTVTTLPPNATTDTDGDGVPDVIELQLGTNPNSPKQTDSTNQTQSKIHRPNP